MTLFATGISYRTTPIALRERLAIARHVSAVMTKLDLGNAGLNSAVSEDRARLTNLEDFGQMNDVYAKHFTDSYAKQN
jgi:hypothetical protein